MVYIVWRLTYTGCVGWRVNVGHVFILYIKHSYMCVCLRWRQNRRWLAWLNFFLHANWIQCFTRLWFLYTIQKNKSCKTFEFWVDVSVREVEGDIASLVYRPLPLLCLFQLLSGFVDLFLLCATNETNFVMKRMWCFRMYKIWHWYILTLWEISNKILNKYTMCFYYCITQLKYSHIKETSTEMPTTTIYP